MRAVVTDGASLLVEADWQERAAAHAERADRLTAGHRDRVAAGRTHPVEDFLFTYYSLRPAQLRRWHPGPGVVLLGAQAGERAGWRDHVVVTTDAGPGVTLDLAGHLARRGSAAEHVRALLAATAERTAQLDCFGLHEWAMVYGLPPESVRHNRLPLRLGSAGTDQVVREHRLRCTHHDAYRFFTDEARPLNAHRPQRCDQLALEQPGCLHATMDLYKWAYKLGPLVPGDLLLDCFCLARDVRELDMRASPYDVTGLGYEAVPIETAAGKAAYVSEQRTFTDRGQALRTRLLDVLAKILTAS